jgi:hypothetical protein
MRSPTAKIKGKALADNTTKIKIKEEYVLNETIIKQRTLG